MNIDWTSLGLVSVVTVVATVLIVSVVSGGALMLDRAHARAEAGSDGAAGLVALGWSCSRVLADRPPRSGKGRGIPACRPGALRPARRILHEFDSVNRGHRRCDGVGIRLH